MHCLPPQSFIDLKQFPFLSFDIAYARHDNFTGDPLPGYGIAGAWLHEDAAQLLINIHTTLEKLGLKLLIWDAYRPYRATQQMIRWAEQTEQLYLVEEGYIARRSRHRLIRHLQRRSRFFFVTSHRVAH